MNIKLDEDEGNRIPLAVISREKMLLDIPAAKRVLEKMRAQDVTEMLFGEDA